MFSHLEFFLVEALRSLRRSFLMTMVAVITIVVSLTVFGIFLLLTVNLGHIVGTISSHLDLAAYTNYDLSLEDAGALQVKISKIPGVVKVEYISKDEAWKKFKEDFGTKLVLDEAASGNPLPHTFIVQVRSPELLPEVAKEISQLEIIDEVRYSGKLIQQMRTFLNAIRLGGIVLIILFFFATFLIVVNTIRLTVLSRETDIYIMKLVGATDAFVKWPFLIEGLLMGIMGGISSFLILKFSYDAISMRLSQALPFLPLVSDQKLLLEIYLGVIMAGTGLGIVGAYFSVSRVLKSEVQKC